MDADGPRPGRTARKKDGITLLVRTGDIGAIGRALAEAAAPDGIQASVCGGPPAPATPSEIELLLRRVGVEPDPPAIFLLLEPERRR